MTEPRLADASTVPTTKILAIGGFPGAVDEDHARAILPHEVSDTLRLYLQGKIDQLYTRKDVPGVVLLMNVDTVEAAQALLETLPLGRAGLMSFELIPIGPLMPMQFLLLPPTDYPKPDSAAGQPSPRLDATDAGANI